MVLRIRDTQDAPHGTREARDPRAVVVSEAIFRIIGIDFNPEDWLTFDEIVELDILEGEGVVQAAGRESVLLKLMDSPALSLIQLR